MIYLFVKPQAMIENQQMMGMMGQGMMNP